MLEWVILAILAVIATATGLIMPIGLLLILFWIICLF